MADKGWQAELMVASIPAVIAYVLNRWHTKSVFAEQQRATKIGVVIEKMEQVEHQAGQFYLQPGGTPSAQAACITITSQVGNIGRRLEELGRLCPKQREELKRRSLAFRRAVTDGDFQSATRLGAGLESSRFARIRVALKDLAAALDDVG